MNRYGAIDLDDVPVVNYADLANIDDGIYELPNGTVVTRDPRLAQAGFSPAEQWVPYALVRPGTDWTPCGKWHMATYVLGVTPTDGVWTFSNSGTGAITQPGGPGTSLVCNALGGSWSNNVWLMLSIPGGTGAANEVFILSKSSGAYSSGTQGAGYGYNLNSKWMSVYDDYAGYRRPQVIGVTGPYGEIFPEITTLQVHYQFIRSPKSQTDFSYWQLPSMNDNETDVFWYGTDNWTSLGDAGEYVGARIIYNSSLTIDYMAVYYR